MKLHFLLYLIIAISFASINLYCQVPDSTQTEPFETLESDSLNIETEMDEMAESGSTEDETDTLEAEQPWSFDATTGYVSKRIKNGTDLSNSQPLLNIGVGLSHENGFNTGIDLDKRFTGIGGLQDIAFLIGYDFSITDWFSFCADYTYTKYANDSLSAVAGSNHALSFAFDFSFNNLIFDISFDRYFGADQINYLTFTGMYLKKFGDFKILPMAGISWTSYEIKSSRLFTKKGLSFKKMERGLSSVNVSIKLGYDLGGGFDIFLKPGYVYSPISSLSKTTKNFIFGFGVNYSFDF
jgi:hypothetical protein